MNIQGDRPFLSYSHMLESQKTQVVKEVQQSAIDYTGSFGDASICDTCEEKGIYHLVQSTFDGLAETFKELSHFAERGETRCQQQIYWNEFSIEGNFQVEKYFLIIKKLMLNTFQIKIEEDHLEDCDRGGIESKATVHFSWRKDNAFIYQKVNIDKPAFSVTHAFLPQLRKRANLSDCIITNGQVAVAAHKSILFIKSEVLQPMVDGAMVEAQTNTIKILCSDKALELFMDCLYEVDISEPIEQAAIETIQDVLNLAEQYNLHYAKRLCIWALNQRLDDKNVFLIEDLAKLYDDKDLERSCALLKEKLAFNPPDDNQLDKPRAEGDQDGMLLQRLENRFEKKSKKF